MKFRARKPLRFTISEHSTTPLHWDLFLERGRVLKTWSLPKPPRRGPFRLPALEHFDHRAVYLTYEGEISGGRGSVTVWDTGTYEADWQERTIALRLEGKRLKGNFSLEFRKPGPRPEWLFRRITVPREP